MNVVFTEFAVKELNETHSFYELEVEGLGDEFSNEIRNAAKRISKFPEAFPILKDEYKKVCYKKISISLILFN